MDCVDCENNSCAACGDYGYDKSDDCRKVKKVDNALQRLLDFHMTTLLLIPHTKPSTISQLSSCDKGELR